LVGILKFTEGLYLAVLLFGVAACAMQVQDATQEDKSARKSVFVIDANTRVLIEGKPCGDSMSGEAFDTTVTVILGEQVFKGCGRALL
jgi:uncharacterized membrane protein